MGYGAMQLAGPQVWGPPRDPGEAVRLLREAVGVGVNHIDTSDFYGPHVTNQIIKEALHPYPNGLVIVTKVGARRRSDKSWMHAVAMTSFLFSPFRAGQSDASCVECTQEEQHPRKEKRYAETELEAADEEAR
jgi:aryl-alcohol dehydrogenase-like predicted oxidoreductase